MSGPVNSVDLMAKADRACASARVLLDVNDADGAFNRAYYAMFDSARAVLMLDSTALNRDFGKTHGELLNAFGNEFVENGLVSMEIGRSLERAAGIRLAQTTKVYPSRWGTPQVMTLIQFRRSCHTTALRLRRSDHRAITTGIQHEMPK